MAELVIAELWLRASAIATGTGRSEFAIKKQLDRLLASANGTRNLYERSAKSTHGGGRGGSVRQFNVLRLARDFPQFVSPEQLSALSSQPPARIPFDAPPPAAQIPESAEVVTLPHGGLAVREKPAPLARGTQAALPFGERIDLPPDARRIAQNRYAMLAPLLEFLSLPRAERRFRTLDGRTITTSKQLVEYLVRQTFPWQERDGRVVQKRPKKSSLWRWYGSFLAAARRQQNGTLGLAPAIRRDKGVSRVFSVNPEAAAFLRAKFLQEKISNQQLCYDALRANWGAIGARGRCPSLETVRRFLGTLPQPLVTLAQQGPRAWYAQSSPFVLRGPVAVMDWWVLDHRQFDVFAVNTLFDHQPHGEPLRLWLTALYDWGSRKLLGFVFAPTPSSRTVASAFSMAALEAGAIARNFYWDNGEDIKRFERIVLAPELENILEAQVTRAQPYCPRSKPIESWFNRWSQRFDLLWRPAWCGRTPGQCPEDCRAAQKQHAQWRKAAERGEAQGPSPFPLDSDFLVAAMQFIHDFNAAPHPRLDGRTPNEVFDQGHPPERRAQLDRRLLDVLFWQREERIVQQGGCVALLNARYEPTDESLVALDRMQGRRIVVKYDPYNLGHALAVDLDGRLLGELRAQRFLTQSAHGRVSADEISAAARRRSRLLRHYRGSLESLALVSRAMGWRSEAEQLVERGRARFTLPAAAAAGASPALAAAAPGSSAALGPREAKELASPFVSDAVRDSNFWGKSSPSDEVGPMNGEGECD